MNVHHGINRYVGSNRLHLIHSFLIHLSSHVENLITVAVYLSVDIAADPFINIHKTHEHNQ